MTPAQSDRNSKWLSQDATLICVSQAPARPSTTQPGSWVIPTYSSMLNVDSVNSARPPHQLLSFTLPLLHTGGHRGLCLTWQEGSSASH